MNYHPIPHNIELFAYCVNDTIGCDSLHDFVNIEHCYKVIRFVDEVGFYPYGVRVQDYLGSELTQTFFIQRFYYFEHSLN